MVHVGLQGQGWDHSFARVVCCPPSPTSPFLQHPVRWAVPGWRCWPGLAMAQPLQVTTAGPGRGQGDRMGWNWAQSGDRLSRAEGWARVWCVGAKAEMQLWRWGWALLRFLTALIKIEHLWPKPRQQNIGGSGEGVCSGPWHVQFVLIDMYTAHTTVLLSVQAASTCFTSSVPWPASLSPCGTRVVRLPSGRRIYSSQIPTPPEKEEPEGMVSHHCLPTVPLWLHHCVLSSMQEN